MPGAKLCQQASASQPTTSRLKNRAEVAKNRTANPAKLSVGAGFRGCRFQKRGPFKTESLKLVFQRVPCGGVPFQAVVNLRNELFTDLLRSFAQFGARQSTL